MAIDSRNDANLIQRREDRRTLEKMRRKLATSSSVSSVRRSDRTELLKQQSRRVIRVWPWVAVAAVLLLGLNFVLRTQQDRIMGFLGAPQTANNQLAPRPGLSLDEQTRFWAYAAYDLPKLRARFHVSKAVVIDPRAVQKNLERLLAEDLGNEVRKEIFVLQQNAPKPVGGRAKIGGGKAL